ncbi:LysM peptidoglycan-binding domain-containing protein [Phanerochaete sordida]|uniref:LysM peptidoglycan-binding domain-containing protein n=1 Tax=Phanerochaete sordida TaxID=48140 RepID=A0A9P3LIW2_9APHY|nr:LysM peptidoglycan-binding domain-containing protein [Phanerochaete sordida]
MMTFTPSAAPSLCLACSSSLPPHRTSEKSSGFFVTPCCNRPICPACISKNPRLARYNPCLHCLGGVGIVHAHSSTSIAHAASKPQNLDGGLHDDAVYAIGDDDEDEDDEDGLRATPGDTLLSTPSTPPPAYTELDEPPLQPSDTQQTDSEHHDRDTLQDIEDSREGSSSAPSKYYIQPKDTLVGIALKFGVDGRLLCRLNNLPPSTLRTTPHLLHTRTVLQLPPSARTSAPSTPPNGKADPDYEARRARERAEKRLQTVTKETDWRIAKAYVALAEDGDSSAPGKAEGLKKPQADASVEGRAMDQYLDDDEWEAQQRREGRGVQIPPFPYAAQSSSRKGKGPEASRRWRWP